MSQTPDRTQNISSEGAQPEPKAVNLAIVKESGQEVRLMMEGKKVYHLWD